MFNLVIKSIHIEAGGEHMKNLKKTGRWAFLIPYMVMPLIIVLADEEKIFLSVLYSWLFPVTWLTYFKSTHIWLLLVPLCYGVTIVCLNLYDDYEAEGIKNKSIVKFILIMILIRVLLLAAVFIGLSLFFHL